VRTLPYTIAKYTMWFLTLLVFLGFGIQQALNSDWATTGGMALVVIGLVALPIAMHQLRHH
jgi:hypothetical protein